MVREIGLRAGMVTLVDDDDYEWLSRFKWSAAEARHSGNFYAARTEYFVRQDGRMGSRSRQMQQDILYPGRACPKGMKADHANRDTLDNRRTNLSLKSDSASNINRKLFKTNTTGYRGVSWDSTISLFRASVRINGRLYRGGNHATAVDAAMAYNALARRHHGDHACLNIIPEDPASCP